MGQLRPLGIGELLDLALRICVRHWRVFAVVTLLVAVPLQVVASLVTISSLPDDSKGIDVLFGSRVESDPGRQDGDIAASVGGQVVSAGIGLVVVLLAFGACFRIVAEAYVGSSPTWRHALRTGLRRALPLLWVAVLYFLGVLLGTIALIVPGVWLGLSWSLAFAAIHSEDVRGTQALRRSFQLVKGRWWPTFGAILAGYVLASILQTVATFAFALLFLLDTDSMVLGFVVLTLGGILGSLVGTPVQAAIVAVVYFDLRVRKEGLDLDLLADRLGVAPAEGAMAPTGAAPGPPAAGTYPPGEQPPFWPPPPGWTPPTAAPSEVDPSWPAPQAPPGRAHEGWQPPGTP